MLKKFTNTLLITFTVFVLFLPFLISHIAYQIQDFASKPISILDHNFFPIIVSIYQSFFYIIRTPFNTLIYFLILSFIIFLYRIYLGNKKIRSMMHFYKNSWIKIIPNILISTISLTLFLLSFYYIYSFSEMKINIIWFENFFLLFAFFFLTLSLYWTSQNLLKIKLTLKKETYHQKSRIMSFLLLCNAFYAFIIILVINYYFLIFNSFILNRTILEENNFILIILISLSIFFLMTITYKLLSKIEEKQLPLMGLLFLIFPLLILFIFNKNISSIPDYTHIEFDEMVTRFVLIDDQFHSYSYPRIDLNSILNNANYSNEAENLSILKENLLSIEGFFQYRLNTFFDFQEDSMPVIHHLSPNIKRFMESSLSDPKHNLISSFHLLLYLSLADDIDILNTHLMKRSNIVHQNAIHMNLYFPRKLTSQAIKIQDNTNKDQEVSLFNIKGNVSFNNNNIDPESLEIYVSLIKASDALLIKENNHNISISRDIWSYSNPFHKVETEELKFEINNIIHNESEYHFIIIINDPQNYLNNISDFKSNLYNINISPEIKDDYNIIITPIFEESVDVREEPEE